MVSNKNQPIRMCVVCRERFEQMSLIRLQCQKGSLTLFGGVGRSFYICYGCTGHKKLSSQLARQCKSGATEALMNRLKEIIVNDG